jgi:hypothetical protein
MSLTLLLWAIVSGFSILDISKNFEILSPLGLWLPASKGQAAINQPLFNR